MGKRAADTESCPAKEFELFGFLCAMGKEKTDEKLSLRTDVGGK